MPAIGPRRAFVVALVVALVVLTACSQKASPSSSATSPGASTDAGASTDVEAATIRIVSTGTYVEPDPSLGQFEGSFSGSGFIIDASGIAVTNNHIVTGAGSLQVYFSDDPEPRNARVVGASECSDLAVIDIEGDGYPYLAWYDEPITTRLQVFAAGYPLGDPEYTITEGIVSKEEANGESAWASVDTVIEQTAKILPGNSGGPLVTEDGQVVGINYAGSAVDQYFAIGRDEALEVIDTLRGGSDVNSIGINGTALSSTDQSGVWVASVKSGSPADEAGIEPGDFVIKIEGVSVGVDGLMTSYCDVLKSHAPGDPLSIEGIRGVTGVDVAAYQTQVNSRTPDPFAFVTDIAVGAADDEVQQTEETYTYEVVSDDTLAMTVEVPTVWNDRSTDDWDYEGDGIQDGVQIGASTDLQAWREGWEVAGMFFGASATLADSYDAAGLLDDFRNDFSEFCTRDDRYEYEDPAYVGFYDLWLNCGGADATFVVVAAAPADGNYLVLVQVQAFTDADLDALDHILGSFLVVGDLP